MRGKVGESKKKGKSNRPGRPDPASLITDWGQKKKKNLPMPSSIAKKEKKEEKQRRNEGKSEVLKKVYDK